MEFEGVLRMSLVVSCHLISVIYNRYALLGDFELLQFMYICVVISHTGIDRNPVSKADSYENEKRIRKWTKSVFLFCFFQCYGNENGPYSYSQIHLRVS